MKYTLVLLLCLLSFSLASAQESRTKLAIIEVWTDTTIPQTMFLMCSRGLGLDAQLIDSSHLSKKREYKIAIIPDREKEYGLIIGKEHVGGSIFLASGDSLVFLYSPSAVDTLIFDRLGANRAFRAPDVQPRSQWDFYHDMGDRDWASMCAYAEDSKAKIEQTASLFRSQYPDHPAMSNALHSAAIRWFLEPKLRHLQHYWDDGEEVQDPSRLAVLDSMPWNDAILASADELGYLEGDWMNITMMRWQHAGIDTAGRNWSEKQFDLSFSLPDAARNVAVLNSMRDLSFLSPSESVPLAARELARLKKVTDDTAYLAACNKSIARFRMKLPGQPAPNFSLPDTSKRIIALSDFRGKVVYLDFWGTWCSRCLAELPALKTLQRSFAGDTDIAFVSIALESSGSKSQSVEAWKSFILNRELGGTHLYADRQFNNEYVKEFGIQGVPTFMLIGRDGKFIDVVAPRPSDAQTGKAIRDALTQKN